MYHYRKAEQVSVENDDPFRFDKLGRKTLLENLTRVVSTLTQPVVLALNGPWGTGKSTSLRMWQPLLTREGHECIYFNAWENDYADDPLICLLAAVQEQAASTKKSKTWAKTKKLAAAVAKSVAPAAVKLLTYNAVNLEEIKKAFGEHSGDVLVDLAHSVAEKQIDEHVKSRRTVKAFKDALAHFAEEVSQRLDGQTRSFVIIVDELDRCRPTFAIETLERIKHLFNVPNVVFIMALDLDQLAHSARSLYGEGMDAPNYLRRFIDLVCDLPTVSSIEFCRSLYSQFALVEVIERPDEFVVELFSAIADAFHLSLRSQEQLFAQVAVAARLLRGTVGGATELAILMVVLRAVDRNLFTQYMDGFKGATEVLRVFDQQPAVAAVVKRWPVVDVLLHVYSRVEGEMLAARQTALSDSTMANTSTEQRQRAVWKSKLFQDLHPAPTALDKVIRPALEFTATVRRSA